MLNIVGGYCALIYSRSKDSESEKFYREFVRGFNSLVSLTSANYRVDVALQIISSAESLNSLEKDRILKSIFQCDPSLEITRLCYLKSGYSSEIYCLSLFKLVNGLLEAYKAEGVGQ
jgi:hypothetical protein